MEALEDRSLRASIAEFPLPTSGTSPQGIALGPDGALWFTETQANRIGRITTSGTVTEYPIATGDSGPWDIVAGPDGALWFTEFKKGRIGRITTSGLLTEYRLPAADSGPEGITVGPDGALWFTEFKKAQIGRITTSGSLVEFRLPSGGSEPEEITAGPDGALWYTDPKRNEIGRITTSGVVTEYRLPGGQPSPEGIVAGPDGALWFTETKGNQIGRITTSGTITEYSVPTGGGSLGALAAGPDGALWFTLSSKDTVGRITTSGVVTEYLTPTTGSGPSGIVAGPDGNLWFAESQAGQIGRLHPSPPPPTATGLAIAATEGLAFHGAVATFTDAYAQALPADFVATIDWGDGTTTAGTVVEDPASGVFTVVGDHTYRDEGAYALSVTIGVEDGATTAAGTATVADAPLSASGINVSVAAGAPFSGQVASFSDADPGGLASDFTATIDWGDGQASPGAVSYDAATGRFFVSGANTYAAQGLYNIRVDIRDVGGASASAGSVAAVSGGIILLPMTATGASLAGVEGSPVGGVVARFTDLNLGSLLGNYSAIIDWGDGTTTAGVIGPDGLVGSYAVSGNHTYRDEGSYVINVAIRDAGGPAVATSGSATVADAPLTASGASLAATEGAPFSGTVATFTDGNPFASPGEFTATVDWGDGTTTTGLVSYDVARRAFAVAGTHTYARWGSYSVGVTIADVGGATATASGQARVADAPLTARGETVRAVEGLPFSGVVATFVDANPRGLPGDFSAVIDWGDGTTSGGLIAYDPAGRVFTVRGTHVYEEEGGYRLAVAITDGGGSSAAAAGFADVEDAPLTVRGTTLELVVGEAFSGVAATFTDADIGESSLIYNATIDWGDGHTTTGQVGHADDGQGFVVRGTHAYDRSGTFTIAVHVRDAGGAEADGTSTADVRDQIQGQGVIFQATAGSAFSGPVASFRDSEPETEPGDYTATIDWGGGRTTTGQVVRDGQGGFTVSGTYTYDDAGTRAVGVTVGRDDGPSIQIWSLGIIQSSPISPIRAQGTTISARAGTPFEGVVATFSDDRSEEAGSYTATIDWGDGSTSGGVVVSDGDGGYTVSGDHVFGAVGTYPVAVRISVEQRPSASALSAAVVVGDGPSPGDGGTPGGGLPGGGGPVGGGTTGPPTIGPGIVISINTGILPPVVIAGPAVAVQVGAVSPAIPPPSPPAPVSAPAVVGGPPGTHFLATQGNSGQSSPAPATSSSGSTSASSNPGGPSAETALAAGSAGPVAGPAPAPGPANAGEGGGLGPGLVEAMLAAVDAAGDEAGAVAAATAVRQAIPAPLTSGAERDFPRELLWRELDDLNRQVSAGGLAGPFQEVLGVSVVAYVGYVLLNSRSGLWLLSLLLARPLWNQFDPLQVLIDWEEQRKGTGKGRDEDGREDEDAEGEGEDESLQSLVESGGVRGPENGGRRNVADQSGPGKPHYEPPVRRARARALAGPRRRSARRA